MSTELWAQNACESYANQVLTTVRQKDFTPMKGLLLPESQHEISGVDSVVEKAQMFRDSLRKVFLAKDVDVEHMTLLHCERSAGVMSRYKIVFKADQLIDSFYAETIQTNAIYVTRLHSNDQAKIKYQGTTEVHDRVFWVITPREDEKNKATELFKEKLSDEETSEDQIQVMVIRGLVNSNNETEIMAMVTKMTNGITKPMKVNLSTGLVLEVEI
ncbi:hypothetical protein GYB22_01235 [bacterium]|nr:hypothetical protein [bacterium]